MDANVPPIQYENLYACWRMANATSRLLAHAIYERGMRVEWSDGPTVPRMG